MTSHLESRSRDRVLRVVSEQGPVSIPVLAENLALTETAVRRHVENLHSEGLVEPREAAGPRRRGRPARSWVLTSAGHRALVDAHDDLASAALRFVRDTGGATAIAEFAERRATALEQRVSGQIEASGDTVTDRTEALVAALSAEGYAASARPVGDPDSASPLTGIQLCQGHCPVQHVAAEFPELCEAETEAFGRLLGVHVQRLATLAHGEHVCTTFVPSTPSERSSR